MTEETAVAVQDQAKEIEGMPLPARQLLSTAQLPGGVEQFEQTVVLPAIFQYAINRYGSTPKVMLTADAYDYLNRVMSVQLWQPKKVIDEHGKEVGNPIHRPDYIYIRMVGMWYNDVGQLVSYQEDLEVDYQQVWNDQRLNSRSAKVRTDAEGKPIFSTGGVPIVDLSPEDELKALKALSQLRTFGLRYAQTVAKVRILKTACGIRTLPLSQPRPYPIKVLGHRDRLTPDQRVKQAEKTLGTMFGGAVVHVDENAGLTSEEIREAQDIITDATEELDHEISSAASAERDDRPAPRRVGPDVEPQELGLDAKPARRRA